VLSQKKQKLKMHGRKRSYNRAFGAIAAHKFYGRGASPKKSMSSKKRTKTNKSYTKTKRTKSVQPSGNDSYGGGVTSYQKIVLGPSKPPKFSKVSAPLVVNSNSAISGSSIVGRQLILQPAASTARSSLQAWEAIIQNNARQQVGNTPGTGFADVKVFLRTVSQEHRIMNMTIRPIQIEIFDYVFKRDSTDNIQTMLANASSYDAAGNIATAPWVNLTTTFPGWKPNDSTAFNQFLRIVKRKKVWLQGGESHVHIVNAVFNKSWNAGMVHTNSGQMKSFKGFTFGTFIICLGSLSAGATTGSNQVDIGSSEVGCYTIERAHIRPMMSNALAQTQQYQGVAPISGEEEFVDEVYGGIWKVGTGILSATDKL